MSREGDAMQFVLDLLTDGIITSQVQQIGHTPHSDVVEDQLPFVQVYSAIAENQDVDTRPDTDTVSFQLDIIDNFGQSEKLRSAMEALSTQLLIDSSFQGTQFKGFLTLRTIAERRDDERAVAGATVTVEFKEGLSITSGGVVQLIDFSDVGLFLASSAQIEDSRYVNGAIGMQRDVASSAALQLRAAAATGQSGFPLDLTVTHRVRFLSYTSPEFSNGNGVSGTPLPQLFLLRDNSGFNGFVYQPTAETFVGTNGWAQSSYNLDDPPDSVLGSGVDLDDVVEVRFSWNMFFLGTFTSIDFGLLAAAFGYGTRDTGVNNSRGYAPGF